MVISFREVAVGESVVNSDDEEVVDSAKSADALADSSTEESTATATVLIESIWRHCLRVS